MPDSIEFLIGWYLVDARTRATFDATCYPTRHDAIYALMDLPYEIRRDLYVDAVWQDASVAVWH